MTSSNNSRKTEMKMYEKLSSFRKPLFDHILNYLSILPGSKGLDAASGIGFFTRELSHEVGPNGNMTGMDIDKDIIEYALDNYNAPNINYIQGDLNVPLFEQNSFDFIFSADTVWPGSKEIGCPAENPSEILSDFKRILKPGGKVFLCYWTGQRFLPGYPIIENQLNAAISANLPFREDMPPELHVMNAKKWLSDAEFHSIKSTSFLGNLEAPMHKTEEDALLTFCDMLWGHLKDELDDETWSVYKKLTDRNDPLCITKNENYCGYYIYTLFEGVK